MREPTQLSSKRLRYLPLAVSLLSCSGLFLACGKGRPAEVSPAEIPDLEARLADEPRNAALLLRYSAALFSGGQCDSAIAVARLGMVYDPSDALGPLVVGQCLEREADLAGQAGDSLLALSRYDQAVAAYRRFLSAYGEVRGATALRARELLVLRSRATLQARIALRREAELGARPSDPRTVAVLPLYMVADSSYLPLSRGLAQIIISDLALLQRFRMVERLELSAILDELALAQGGRVDPTTAARVGRLIRAGRMVQGLTAIPPEGDMRLEANIVLSTGEVTGPEVVTGRFDDLMRLEKDLVLGIAGRLGYVLSEAERQMILENGTQNLVSFLAYSNGLVAEDLGDYSAAAAHYAEAVRQDPGFNAARQQHQAAAAAPAVQQASAAEVTTIVEQEVEAPEELAEEPVEDAVNSTVGDLAATQSEQTAATTQSQQATQTSTTSNTSNTNTTTQTTGTSSTLTGTITIRFRLP